MKLPEERTKTERVWDLILVALFAFFLGYCLVTTFNETLHINLLDELIKYIYG